MASSSDLAQLAASLRDNEAFQSALDAMKAEALANLAEVDADNKNRILKLQATVQVVDGLRANLEQFIRSGKPKRPVGLPT